MKKNIYITELDKIRLLKLISEAREYNLCKKENLDKLGQELERAQLVKSEEIPSNVITMNSCVAFEDLETGERFTYTLVFPNEAKLAENKISILAPIGTAILGFKVGDVIEWPVPDGMIKLKVEEVLFQPEASGNYAI